MLDINPGLIHELILKIREFQAKEDVVMPEEQPNPSDDYDWAQVLADHQDDLTYQEIVETIDDMEPDQKYELLGLLLLGRGDAVDFASAVEEAHDIEENRVSQFILSVPLAPDFISDALIQLGYDSESEMTEY